MANVPACTQFDNYGPRKIHISGIKRMPYDFTFGGVKYADGRTYVGDADSPQPASYTLATATPGCRSCHGGC